MASLKLELLGKFQAFLGQESLDDFRTKKVQALLIYLAIEREAQDREYLTELFWPGMPERSARANLRQIIYYLRLIFSELDAPDGQENPAQSLFVNRQSVQLNPEADIVVDIYQFENHLASSRMHNHFDLLSCPSCHEDLQEAAELYRGNFLEDFYLEDSNPFEEWALEKREAYRRQVLDALETLTTMHSRQREYPIARTYANRQIELDNLRESAYRQLMEIMALEGQRSEAMAVYEKCRRLFAEELGMEPSKRTTELYEQILTGDPNFEPGLSQTVRGYDLKEEIGAGNYGSIHRAIQPSINREVAIKVIHRKYANNPEFIRRFEFEAETIAHLEHPHIVPLYDYWRDPDGAFLVMRYLKGGNLLDALKTGPWEPFSTAKILDQVAQGLNAAHKQGIVHRDIKPANILLDEDGNAYLSDFGIAKDAKVQLQLTAVGALMGTPDYISPEQILNDPVTPQADIYSLGAVLFEMLSGERPFADSSVANLFYKHLKEPIALLGDTRPDLPSQIDEVIQRATAKNPKDRYATALEMAAAFRAAIQGTSGQEFEPAIIPVVEELYNPYKGLRAFQEADADDFFGRETLIKSLLKGLDCEDRFLALVGPSGSGKSSVVKAGLIPELHAGAVPGSRNWFVAEMVPGTHPLEELELALWPLAVDPPPSLVEPMQRDTRGMLRTLRRILPEGPDSQLLLVIDQFEELFTLVEDEERRAFFIDSLLLALTAPRSPLRLVVTLRADFYDRPLQYEMLGRLIKNNTEVILPLTSEELGWAVREPARRMGVAVEEGLAETIVSDVADQPGALPLLQYALTELFERRQENGRVLMTRKEYIAIGGVHSALGRKAEEIFAELDTAEQALAQQLFLRLVTLGEGVEDTRRRVLRSELEGINNQPLTENGERKTENSQQLMGQIIDLFGEARLLTFDRDLQNRQATVEVAHEALLREWTRLRGWLAANRNDVRMQRLLAGYAREWVQAGRQEGFLMRGARLDQFAGWAATSTIALTGEEADFLQLSAAAREVREAAEEARLQRELETAQKLAETESARAEEQAQAAGRLRQRATFLVGALIVAALLASAAVFFARQSSQNALAAEQNAADAQSNAALAVTREAEARAEAQQRATAQALAEQEGARADEQRDVALVAQQQAQEEAAFRATAEAKAVQEREAAEDQASLSTSRELAAASQASLDEDPELSVLLAMQALSVTHTAEAVEALHQAVQQSRVRQAIYADEGQPMGWSTMSPAGDRIFTSGPGGGVMWDTKTGDILFTALLEDFADDPPEDGTVFWINRADFSPDGSLLALPLEILIGDESQPGAIAFLNPENGEQILVFPAHDSGIQDVTFSSDGSILASADVLNSVKTWDVAATLAAGNGQELVTFCCHEDWVYSVNFSPDDSRIITSSADNTVRVWDVESGTELLTVVDYQTTDAVFSPDGEYLILGEDLAIVVLDADSGEFHSSVPGSGQSFGVLQFSPDGTRLAASNFDSKIRIWNYNPGELDPNALLLPGHDLESLGLTFSADGQSLASSSLDGSVRLWDVSPNGTSELGAFDHDSRVMEVAFGPDGSWLASASLDGTAKVWDTAARAVRFTLTGHEDSVVGVAVHPDGRTLATASNDGTVRIWDAQTGTEIRVIAAHEIDADYFFSGARTVAFAPDGQRLASGGADNVARIWDLTSGEKLVEMVGHEEPIYFAAFMFAGSRLVTAGNDRIIKGWDTADGRELWSIPADGSIIWGAAVSPDGRMLVTGHGNGQVMLWSFADADSPPQLIWHFEHHPQWVGSPAFSPDGQVIVVPGADQTALYDAQTGEHIIDLGYPASAGAFSPDGRIVATAGVDGQVRLMAADVEGLLALAQSRVTRSLTAEECRKYLHVDACPTAE